MSRTCLDVGALCHDPRVSDSTGWDETVRGGLVWHWGPDGEPISLRRWSELFEDRAAHELIWHTVVPTQSGPDTVITAWLGDNGGEPLPPGARASRVWGTLVCRSTAPSPGHRAGIVEGEQVREFFAPDYDTAHRDHRAQVRLLLAQHYEDVHQSGAHPDSEHGGENGQ